MCRSLVASCVIAFLSTTPAWATPRLHVGGRAMHDDQGAGAGTGQYSHDPYYIDLEPATASSGPLLHDTGMADWHGHARARSATTASFGSLGVYSYSSMYAGPTRAQAVARADACFEDDWLITLPGQTAPFRGMLDVTVHVYGNLIGEDGDVVHSYCALDLINYTKGEDQYKLPLGLTDTDITLRVPFQFGELNHLKLELMSETTFYNERGAALHTGASYGDFLHTASVTGLTGYNAQGQPTRLNEMITSSGAVYVPEPSTLLISTAILVLTMRRPRLTP